MYFRHGGPGRGTTRKDQTFFDPSVYRVIITDQRGGGKSTPTGELKVQMNLFERYQIYFYIFHSICVWANQHMRLWHLSHMDKVTR